MLALNRIDKWCIRQRGKVPLLQILITPPTILYEHFWFLIFLVCRLLLLCRIWVLIFVYAGFRLQNLHKASAICMFSTLTMVVSFRYRCRITAIFSFRYRSPIRTSVTKNYNCSKCSNHSKRSSCCNPLP